MVKPLSWKQPTRRALLWIGAALVLLPTIFVIVTFLQPREYQSSVFLELDSHGVVKRPLLIDRDTLYGILILIGMYLPGIVVMLTALLSRSSRLKASGAPTI